MKMVLAILAGLDDKLTLVASELMGPQSPHVLTHLLPILMDFYRITSSPTLLSVRDALASSSTSSKSE